MSLVGAIVKKIIRQISHEDLIPTKPLVNKQGGYPINKFIVNKTNIRTLFFKLRTLVCCIFWPANGCCACTGFEGQNMVFFAIFPIISLAFELVFISFHYIRLMAVWSIYKLAIYTFYIYPLEVRILVVVYSRIDPFQKNNPGLLQPECMKQMIYQCAIGVLMKSFITKSPHSLVKIYNICQFKDLHIELKISRINKFLRHRKVRGLDVENLAINSKTSMLCDMVATRFVFTVMTQLRTIPCKLCKQ